ncbi:MAG: type II toxin-antitoxin system HicA family toxin [Candidatus Jacksonbacteria bacterium]|jgi:predicted RNA binding protein YcfA (HicA-like mRNA interferase family)|nr:type II toxin-antitoxin system HicA family toxin [Candidatus Jacksonbacteria bacterium]MBT6034156.1 type II toxin-antitoxin system HicA family toxin [Candidatus Jacksonbacteria bacterium]MBT6301349.1 type II toxin-antitoxin system HicA family toxin [Candidatus Jacksonbacteria bacterium]MBT6756723.1 type II toxin-antitoxin system HicA family toxin [Candidatus Jacksonbacteria bacterium]MBT6954997.1 type II toxin-antitoxin system HicA family toxin [Candidatus Jacksonbacteria bacterium]
MPRPYPLRIVLKVLKSRGFFFVSQTGSHAKYRNHGRPPLTVIIPIHGKEIRYGTFRSILRQSGLEESNFRK